MKHKISKYLSILLLIAAIIILIMHPINRFSIKITTLGLFILLFISILALFWKKKIIRFTVIGIVAASGIFLSVTGPGVSKEIIRKEYISSLKKYEGVKYLWGGENSYGIDCSGLVRKGLIDTFFKLGFKEFSPQYIRQALYIWFYDSSAEALRDGYREYTVPIMKDITLNSLEHSKIVEGDIMVTENCVHTMVYIGNNFWIQADPGKGKVIIEMAPSKDNVWYDSKSRIVRWKALAEIN